MARRGQRRNDTRPRSLAAKVEEDMAMRFSFLPPVFVFFFFGSRGNETSILRWSVRLSYHRKINYYVIAITSVSQLYWLVESHRRFLCSIATGEEQSPY